MELGRTSGLRRSAAALLLGTALAAGIVACGDDEQPTIPATTETEVVVPTVTQTVTGPLERSSLGVSLTDFALNPANPTVKRGIVTITAANDGMVTHALAVETPGGELQTGNIQTNQSKKLVARLNQTGSFEWYCPVSNHRDLGMEGEITVK